MNKKQIEDICTRSILVSFITSTGNKYNNLNNSDWEFVGDLVKIKKEPNKYIYIQSKEIISIIAIE